VAAEEAVAAASDTSPSRRSPIRPDTSVSAAEAVAAEVAAEVAAVVAERN
jgi:hypothetical protein